MGVYQILFSPTGGTKKAADLIMGEVTDQWEVVDISRVDEPRPFRTEDVCVVAVPSFGGRVPKLVEDRLRHLRGFGARAVFVVSYGNRAYDDTLLELKNILGDVGFRCCAAVAAVTEHSIVRKYGAGRPDGQDEDKLKAFGREIRRVLESEEVPIDLQVPGNRTYKARGTVLVRPKTGPKCNGCQICARECPAGAIKMDDPRETSLVRCIGCMRCVQVCPKDARIVGKLSMIFADRALEKVCTTRKEPELFL